MGHASWSAESYARASVSYSSKSRSELFQSRSIRKDFDPKNIKMRESCDSEINPNSTALIFGLDVTGSMGFIAESIAKEGLGKIVEGIINNKPVSDPHVMMMALGDAFYDNYPLQVTQFEADIRIAEQLISLYLEGGGGGNNFESYDLAWHFAITKTKIDCFDKRGKKGYLFTIGDELPPKVADQHMLSKIGIEYDQNVDLQTTLENVKERYDVFHIIIEEGNYAKRVGSKPIYDEWFNIIGKRALLLDNYKNLPEVVLAAIMVNEGNSPDDVISGFNDDIKNSISRAIYGVGQ